MNFNFNTGRITLIFAPVDMRESYERFSLIAAGMFGIDVDAGKDFAIFISRPRKIVKMIWIDERGASLLTRRLKEGTCERFCVQDDCRQRLFTPKVRNLEHSHDASQTFGHPKSHTLGQPAKGQS